MKKGIFWMLLSFLIVLALVLSSCGPAEVGEEEEEEEEEEEGPSGDLRWVGATPGTRRGLDPCTGYKGSDESEGLALLFEGLVGKSVEGETLPRLAKSWEVGPNWAYMDFTLEEGVKFHNGEAFTAEDVKFSVERYLVPDLMWSFAPQFNEYLDRVEVLGDYHVRFYFNKPFPAFFHTAAYFMGMVPKDYIEEVGDEYFAYHPVGTGPCRFVDFKKDEFFQLEAVDNHWRHTPDFKDFYQFKAEDTTVQFAMLQAGEVDFSRINPQYIETLEADPDFRIIFIKYTDLRSIQLYDAAYPEPSPWHDERVRKAAILAVDRESICKYVLKGTGEPWKCLLPPYCLGYDPSLKADPYDPERARELMAEAGYADGFDTGFFTHTAWKPEAEAVAEYWKDVGIRVDLALETKAVRAERHTSCEERDTVSMMPEPYWVGGTHPATALVDVMGTWCGVPIPDWLQEAYDDCNAAVTEEEIIEAGREIEILMRESGIWLPMWASHGALGVGPRIESFEPPMGLAHPSRFEYITLKRE